MRFLKKQNKIEKSVLIISDLHLGAGAYIKGRKNLLEDFDSDQELVEFFNYFSSGLYQSEDVEVIINGDFLDLLAVPFVPYFDDEYWSLKASKEKLELIIQAHSEVFDSIKRFLAQKNKKLLYIIGNHDAELVFDELKNILLDRVDANDNFIISNDMTTYSPVKGVYLQHGHEYEAAHDYDPHDTTITTNEGYKYFKPSWGATYVTHIINRFKQQRVHANAVRPIKNFLIHGLIFDTFFTLKFMVANVYFFIMVRFLYYMQFKMGLKSVIKKSFEQLALFEDYESITRDFFKRNLEAKVLIVGHTHEPVDRYFDDGTRFINTGTWTKMVNLDLTPKQVTSLTFCHISIINSNFEFTNFDENIEIVLRNWRPQSNLPYEDAL